ncbi:type VII secretion system-associated protein [Streptomyces kunmingensis]|uniref:Type VII secretion system-associated protein n=1 Tax=Streptomyces kunmingensis TaxID=68225 RepID=A0ABU6CE58_9ACTN|nr:type VII secretion system-associated protein [Streptomyces kunmingensis]MEB3962999.1 type VII secretion system-associated protein [Streptomyces kunmingensis]
MAEDLTKLDPATLRAFIDNDVNGFHGDLVTVRTTTPDVQSLYDLGGSPTPLLIGQMGGDGDSGGKSVIGNLSNAAKAVDAVLNKHVTAFDDLERNLNEVLSSMKKAQEENLAAVDGQKFLTAIGDYTGDMGGTGGVGGASGGAGSPTTPASGGSTT